MPGRTTPLVIGEFYHIFNRGNDRREIFNFPRDFNRLIKTIYYYHFSGKKIKFSLFTKSKFNFLTPIAKEKLVEIYAYCLMPNHFHLLLKQLQDGGIAKFLSQISNSYTKYFNTKYNHSGSLLQGTYKQV